MIGDADVYKWDFPRISCGTIWSSGRSLSFTIGGPLFETYILTFSRMIGDADISEVICSKPRLLNFIYILISYNISKIVGDAGILC